ncbi:MAG: putative metalloprotease CJM1_0395 family protein [Rhodothalassiaceae bacterium]
MPAPRMARAGRQPAGPVASPPLLSPASVAALQQVAAQAHAQEDSSPSQGSGRGTTPEAVRLPNELTEEEQAQVAALKARDREVRAHEGAHRAAGGDLTGPPRFEFETGPDGRQYAVGGEVSIDRSPEPGDPEATIAKLERVIRAALAPAEPSSQDLAVAAQARADLLQARAEAARQSREELFARTV